MLFPSAILELFLFSNCPIRDRVVLIVPYPAGEHTFIR